MVQGQGVWGWEGVGGEGVKGGGAGDILSTLPYILHYHMVHRPKGTSHNDASDAKDVSNTGCVVRCVSVRSRGRCVPSDLLQRLRRLLRQMRQRLRLFAAQRLGRTQGVTWTSLKT